MRNAESSVGDRRGRALCCLLVAIALGAVACKGGASDKPLFDPLHADQLTHEALIAGKDLPGTGWRVVTDDMFNDPAALGAAGSLCDSTKSMVADSAKGLLGHAQRGFELASPQLTRVGTTVSVEIMAYDLETKPDLLVVTLRERIHDGSLVKCLATSRSAGRLLSTVDVEPVGKAPANGAAVAFDREFSALTGPALTRRDELYAWQQSNVVVLLSISAPKADFSADLSKAALKKTQEDILKASKRRY